MLNHGDNFRIPEGGKTSVYIHIQWNSRSFESAGVSEVGVPVCFSGNRFLQEGGSGEGGGDAGEGIREEERKKKAKERDLEDKGKAEKRLKETKVEPEKKAEKAEKAKEKVEDAQAEEKEGTQGICINFFSFSLFLFFSMCFL